MPVTTIAKFERPDWFDELADSSLVRIQQIVATPKNPKPLINLSASTWWRLVRSNVKHHPQSVYRQASPHGGLATYVAG